MPSSGMSGYQSYSTSAGHVHHFSCDNSDADGGPDWPECLLDSANSAAVASPTELIEDSFIGTGGRTTPTRASEMNQDNMKDEDDVIWFPLERPYQGDRELENIFDCDDERAVILLARDLQVVLSSHLLRMTGQKLRSINTHVSFDRLGPPFSLTNGLTEVINKLISVRQAVNSLLDGGDDIAVKSSVDGPNPARETLLNLVGKNYKGLFLSKLLCRYNCSTQCLPRSYADVADYCISKNANLADSEYIYEDVQGLVVFRYDMQTLDIGLPIAPSVINAWARSLMQTSTTLGTPEKLYLDVVVKDNNQSEDEQIDHWFSWIAASNNRHQIQKPEMIFIPVLIGSHYTVMIVDFLNHKIVCIDTVYRASRSAWEIMESKLLVYLWKVLDRLGDDRKQQLTMFTMQLSYPPWSRSIHDHDSGVTVMHMMECYSPASPFSSPTLCLNEEHIRVRKRVYFCAFIASTTINLQRVKVIEAANRLVELKCNNLIFPSEAVKRYRSQLQWTPMI